MEFRQAKFMYWDIIYPVILIEKQETECPKREDEDYER